MNQRAGSLKKIKKIDKTLARPTKKKERKSSSKREVYRNKSLPQETGNILNEQPNLTPKAIRERRTKNPQNQQKERNRKDPIRNK